MKYQNIILNNKEDVVAFLKKESLINQLYEIEYTNNLVNCKKDEYFKLLKSNLYDGLKELGEFGVYINLLHKNKKIIGFSISSRGDKESAYIDRIAIRKEHQARGLGRKLLINTVAKIRTKGFIRIDMVANPALHRSLKQLTAQANINGKRRQYNSNFRYSMSKRKLDKKRDSLTVTIKKQKRPVRPKLRV